MRWLSAGDLADEGEFVVRVDGGVIIGEIVVDGEAAVVDAIGELGEGVGDGVADVAGRGWAIIGEVDGEFASAGGVGFAAE